MVDMTLFIWCCFLEQKPLLQRDQCFIVIKRRKCEHLQFSWQFIDLLSCHLDMHILYILVILDVQKRAKVTWPLSPDLLPVWSSSRDRGMSRDWCEITSEKQWILLGKHAQWVRTLVIQQRKKLFPLSLALTDKNDFLILNLAVFGVKNELWIQHFKCVFLKTIKSQIIYSWIEILRFVPYCKHF